MDNVFLMLIAIALIITSIFVFSEIEKTTYDILVDGVLYEDVKYKIDDGCVIIRFEDESQKIIHFEEIEVIEKKRNEK